MLTKIKDFVKDDKIVKKFAEIVKNNQANIICRRDEAAKKILCGLAAERFILAMAIALISLFSFAMGYLTARYQEKESIRIESAQENP